MSVDNGVNAEEPRKGQPEDPAAVDGKKDVVSTSGMLHPTSRAWEAKKWRGQGVTCHWEACCSKQHVRSRCILGSEILRAGAAAL